MWRSVCNKSSLKKLKFSSDSYSILPSSSSLLFSQDSAFLENARSSEAQNQINYFHPERDFVRIGGLHSQIKIGNSDFGFSDNSSSLSGSYRGYASVAQAVVSTEDEDDEVQELLQEMKRENKVPPKLVGGMGQGKYAMLRKRQIKMETEAWEEAAREYQELLEDMCEQKLAPNLPYMKSLFLGWFEPFKNAIVAEQELCMEGNNRISHAPYIDQLPADMMAVITMHKLMGLLMIGGGTGSCRVVQAACQIGEAIEHEARIHKFLEKTKKKNASNKDLDDGSDPVTKQQEKLRKKVTVLMRKQRLHQVRGIVKEQDNTKPWGQDAQAKVGSRLIQLLIETAYIQPPVDQLEDGPPDIRPAFVHDFKSVDTQRVITTENQPVRWVTPLGLPVVQPYRKLGRHLIKTSLQILTLQCETDKVMAKQQRTAFPPNFVHSLDGSHMMMTAIACKEASLNFAGVYDSYWTHACDVDKMNRILREKFVELYEAPILENLLDGFQTSFPKLSFLPPYQSGATLI